VHGRACPTALLALATALASAGCARVRGTAESPAVTRLELTGTRALDPDEILARIATQPSEGPPPIPILGPLLFQLALELEVRRRRPRACRSSGR